MATELLPCPFCGGNDLITDSADGVPCWWVHCGGCGADGKTARTEAEATAVWNRRARLSQPAEGSAAAGVSELCNVVERLRAEGRYVDEEGEATNALEDLLASLAAAPATGTAQQAPVSEQERRDARYWQTLLKQPGLSVFFDRPVRFRPFDCPHEIEVRQVGRTDLPDALDALTREAGEQEGASNG